MVEIKLTVYQYFRQDLLFSTLLKKRKHDSFRYTTYFYNSRQLVRVVNGHIQVIARVFVLVYFSLKLVLEVLRFQRQSSLQKAYRFILLLDFCIHFS